MNTITQENDTSHSTHWTVEKFRNDCLRLQSRLEGLFPWDICTEFDDGPDFRARITCTVGTGIGRDPVLVFVVDFECWHGDLDGIDRASLQKFWEVLPYCKSIEVHLPR